MFKNNWFDDCARAIAGPVSRRQALGLILGTLAGVAAVAVRPRRVARPPAAAAAASL